LLPFSFIRPCLGCVVVYACVVAAPTFARAQEKVKVTVLTILATDRDKIVDAKLECVAREVQKLEPKLTGFRLDLKHSSCQSLEAGSKVNFPLVDDQVATVVVQHGADKDNRVSLKVKPPQIGEIFYTCCCGKFFPIVTRYQTKNKDRLIIAIMVKPCHKKSP
jgi:hypothetical protein